MTVESILPKDRKHKLDSLFEAFSVVAEGTYVFLCDMYYDCSRWSKTLVEDYGLPSEYMYAAGEIWEERVHPEDRKVYHDTVENIFKSRAYSHDIQYRARRQNGEYDLFTCQGFVITDERGQSEYFAGILRIHGQQSHIDTLTGLRNQYGFFSDIRTRIRNRTKAVIAIVGIGKFTEINEVYGYEMGNAVIQRFGRYLLEHVGNRGGTYRLDGSKFAVISDTQTVEELRGNYEQFRTYFREGLDVDGTFLALELNAGVIALEDFNTDEQTVYACLNCAYDDSKANKHGSLVEFRINPDKNGRLEIERLHSIRNSIPRKCSGFYLLYQPVVDAETEKIVAAEALLRWKNDRYGVVPPDSFIPILERDPLFPELGEWILRRAVEDAEKIRHQDPNFIIHVNLSYVQLEQPDFIDRVWNILRTTGFPPDHLCLEITERCRLLDMNMLLNIVVALRAGGVMVALDDFGTGYSSIGILKNLPFDIIKIDRSFVQNIETDEMEEKLVAYFSDVGGLFGASVCVEGIETAGMRDIMRKYRIHSFQGYYYSRPVEAEEIMAKMNGNA